MEGTVTVKHQLSFRKLAMNKTFKTQLKPWDIFQAMLSSAYLPDTFLSTVSFI